MAVTWFERQYLQKPHKTRGANWYACVQTANLLLDSGCIELRSKFLKGKRGPQRKVISSSERKKITNPRRGEPIRAPGSRKACFAELDALIELEEEEKRPASPEALQLAGIIRSQVGSFRRKHRDWRQLFEGWYGSFRSDFQRDANWYEEQEQVYLRRLQMARKSRKPTDPLIGMSAVNLARLYHEQRRYVEAEGYYQEAVRSYRSASVKKDFRQLVLAWIADQLENCRKRRPHDPDPIYRLDKA